MLSLSSLGVDLLSQALHTYLFTYIVVVDIAYTRSRIFNRFRQWLCLFQILLVIGPGTEKDDYLFSKKSFSYI